MSENIVRDINILNCPNVADLALCYVHGLKTLNISKPYKLERLAILAGEVKAVRLTLLISRVVLR